MLDMTHFLTWALSSSREVVYVPSFCTGKKESLDSLLDLRNGHDMLDLYIIIAASSAGYKAGRVIVKWLESCNIMYQNFCRQLYDFFHGSPYRC